jgi:hypothetical protein
MPLLRDATVSDNLAPNLQDWLKLVTLLTASP